MLGCCSIKPTSAQTQCEEETETSFNGSAGKLPLAPVPQEAMDYLSRLPGPGWVQPMGRSSRIAEGRRLRDC